ncbi:ABC-three component system protein [Nitrospirillum amazonense]|uniref:ABC-three component system protein n=1 Tax=Nitrospirillum amazonense TaxID=28077 RepID=UPI002DD43740|nr:ABC-three component system protein [Nitrospirillum amazonense]MEC4589682.1 ABC-three component system protein [Nitrospirillum amazonense]
MKPPSRPISVTRRLGAADPLEIRSGPSIPPIERIKLFSDVEWEACVDEWASSLSDYALVERAGGAGDMGCDIIATVKPAVQNGPWDNFQCKHYDHPLTPSDIWLELGKLCYFTYLGEYSYPRKYYFVAPRGVGTKLSSLLKKPDLLKAELIAQWPEKCAPHLTSKAQVPLETALLAHIKALDFSRIGHLPPLKLIEGHMATRFFAVRFGLGLPARPAVSAPPDQIEQNESRYVSQLLEAYCDNLKIPLTNPENVPQKHSGHFKRARESFYCAEALRSFSRDTLPDGAFENLQEQIHDGVIDIAEANYACGLTRLNATLAQATALSLTSSALLGRVEIADRRGICHQLANEDRFVWVPKNG